MTTKLFQLIKEAVDPQISRTFSSQQWFCTLKRLLLAADGQSNCFERERTILRSNWSDDAWVGSNLIDSIRNCFCLCFWNVARRGAPSLLTDERSLKSKVADLILPLALAVGLGSHRLVCFPHDWVDIYTSIPNCCCGSEW